MFLSVPREDYGSLYPKCQKFLELVQEMMNEGVMEFCGKMDEQNVSVLQGEALKPVTIFYRGGGQQASREVPHFLTPRLVVKIPTPFHYTSDKTVPWNYTSQAVVEELQAATEQKQETSINDVAGTRGMTSNGRCYVSIDLEARE